MNPQTKIVEIKPLYLRTGKMALLIGRSTRWLKEQKDVLFLRGIHYHQPEGEREPFWDIAKVDEWVRSQENNEDIDLILNKMLS